MNRALGFLGFLVVLSGCGNDSRPNAVKEIGGHADGGAAGATSRAGGSAGAAGDGASDDGGAAGDGAGALDAPLVEVLSPKPADDPNDDKIIEVDAINVSCQVTASESASGGAAGAPNDGEAGAAGDGTAGSVNPNAGMVDEATISIELLVGDEVLWSDVGQPTDKPGIYEANIVLTDVPAGPVTLRCSASDGSVPPLTGQDSVSTFLDKGPSLTVASPEADAAYSLRRPLDFDFSATPQPLVTRDPGAEVAAVVVTVDGREISDIPEPDDDGNYLFTVDLQDSTVFNPIPSGDVAVQVAATNTRGVEIRKDFHVMVDGKPPTISVTPLGEVVGGKVTLEFTVSDADTGVDPATVLVTVNSRQFYYDESQIERWLYSPSKSSFSFVFDEADLDKSAVQASITIDASDKAGNSTTEPPQLRGASLLVYLDNQPPLVSLDPPSIRERKESGTGYLCSNSFDPLGPAAANDGQVVDATPHFRAFVWDVTNKSGTGDVLYLAGTDPSSVRLFLQDELSTPLLIDTDEDGTCDEVNSEVTDNPVRYQQLVMLSASGNASYQPKDADLSPDPDPPPTVVALGCDYGDATKEPDHLCALKASDMVRVIKHQYMSNESVVYAVSPDSGGPECTGRYWELSSVVDRSTREGWLCLAARASDMVGNVGISPPLRICYDDPDTTAHPSCANSSTEPPTCSDGCDPPTNAGLPRAVQLL